MEYLKKTQESNNLYSGQFIIWFLLKVFEEKLKNVYILLFVGRFSIAPISLNFEPKCLF